MNIPWHELRDIFLLYVIVSMKKCYNKLNSAIIYQKILISDKYCGLINR